MLRNATLLLKPLLPLAALAVTLGGCITFPPAPGLPADRADVALGPTSRLPDFSGGLQDQDGGLWRVAVKERYFAASERECARLVLQRQAPTPATVYQVACIKDDRWYLRPDFTGGETIGIQPSFAPIAALPSTILP